MIAKMRSRTMHMQDEELAVLELVVWGGREQMKYAPSSSWMADFNCSLD